MFQVAHFKEYIPQAFPGGHSMILDAEVLLIDTKTSKPLPFGTLGVHKVRTLQPLHALCFVTQLFFSFSLLDQAFFYPTNLPLLSSPFRKQPFKTPTCAFLFSTVSTSMVWVSWRGNALSIQPLSQKWLHFTVQSNPLWGWCKHVVFNINRLLCPCGLLTHCYVVNLWFYGKIFLKKIIIYYQYWSLYVWNRGLWND